MACSTLFLTVFLFFLKRLGFSLISRLENTFVNSPRLFRWAIFYGFPSRPSVLEKWNLERIYKSQRHFPSIRVFAQQETVEFSELDEIRAHRTARQRRSCIARLEGPAKGRGQAASGLTSERMFCGCPASMAKQAAASITVIDIEILSAMCRCPRR